VRVTLQPPLEVMRDVVRRALAEDMPWGDVTTETLVPDGTEATGRFMVKEDGVVAGLTVAALVFEELDASVEFFPSVDDGSFMEVGDCIAEIRGEAAPILMGERTALNLLQRMSGIATATARYVEAVSGTDATIVDTRKTAPGLRALDKYAVRCGGGANHRFSLSDGVLVKDNHLAALGGVSQLAEALERARRGVPHTTRVEVEVDRLDQIEPVLRGGADIILLDNMSPVQLREAVGLIAGRALTEASGGITLESVRAVAESGVDLISVGALTHSVRALDISLEIELLPALHAVL
jgi:nicotinate-nucleotide pyrophosphorylase (carboxylating)